MQHEHKGGRQHEKNTAHNGNRRFGSSRCGVRKPGRGNTTVWPRKRRSQWLLPSRMQLYHVSTDANAPSATQDSGQNVVEQGMENIKEAWTKWVRTSRMPCREKVEDSSLPLVKYRQTEKARSESRVKKSVWTKRLFSLLLSASHKTSVKCCVGDGEVSNWAADPECAGRTFDGTPAGADGSGCRAKVSSRQSIEGVTPRKKRLYVLYYK